MIFIYFFQAQGISTLGFHFNQIHHGSCTLSGLQAQTQPTSRLPVLLLRAFRLDRLKPLEDLGWQKWEELPPFIGVYPAVSAGS